MRFTTQKFNLSFLILIIFLILINTFFSASCSVQSQDKGVEKAANNISSNTVKENSELERNRKLWRESGISDYKMTVKMRQTGMYSPPANNIEIMIQNNEAVSIKNLEKPEKIIPVTLLERFGNNTIEAMFEKIQSAENQKADKLEVEYDSKFGYPKMINIDKKLMTNDDESYVEIEKFEVIN